MKPILTSSSRSSSRDSFFLAPFFSVIRRSDDPRNRGKVKIAAMRPALPLQPRGPICKVKKMAEPPAQAPVPPLAQRLNSVRGVGAEREAQLARLGLFTIEDALLHAPRRHEDRRHF